MARDYLKIINSLIAKAESTDSDAERDNLLEKADALMLQHAIDDAMLAAATPKNERRKPINEMFQAVDPLTPHWETFRNVLYYIAKLHRVRCAIHYNGNATLVGYHDDVQYVKTRFTIVWLHFAKTIDPRWDSSLTPEHNVYNFKVAGRQWQAIQEVARDHGIDKPFHWFKPAYQRHCRLIGEEPRAHTQRNSQYRNSFVQAFVNRLCARIEEMIRTRDKETSEAGALVLMRDAGVDIDDLFYSLFESLRPMTPEQQEAMLAAARARREREERELQEKLDAMTPAERRRYDAEQARQARKEARDNERYWRDRDKQYDAEGAGAGRASANNVDLSRNSGVGSQPKGEL